MLTHTFPPVPRQPPPHFLAANAAAKRSEGFHDVPRRCVSPLQAELLLSGLRQTCSAGPGRHWITRESLARGLALVSGGLRMIGHM